MKKLFAMIAIVFGFSSAAQAGILIEPYAGYGFGNTEYVAVSGSANENDQISGMGYGLRLGYQFWLPWLAFDYTARSGKQKVSQGDDLDFTNDSLGFVVGVDLPIMFRFWAGYGFSNNLTWKGQNGQADDKFIKGSYTKVGVGWTTLPLLSINLEYQINSFKEYDPGTGEVDVSTVFKTFNSNMYLLSVSLPFEL